MEPNKDLRKKIAGCERMIEEHERKIQTELAKPHPDDPHFRFDAHF